MRCDAFVHWGRCLLALAILCIAGAVAAEEFPSRPIRIVVTYPPGGGTDITARIIGKRLSEKLGQPVIVENKAGAGGSVGTAAVARAAPDGYTLLLGNPGPNAINPWLYANPGYDAERDFAPISVLTTMPLLFCVEAGSPVRSVADLIALGKTKERAVHFGSSGNGSVSHLSGEMLNLMAGTGFVHVPYKGASPLTTAALAGEVPVSLLAGPDASAQVRAGKLRAIASSSGTRSPAFPDVPTLAESGMPDFRIDIWYGLLAPARTPRPVIDRLHQELDSILKEPATRDKLLALSQTPTPTTPEQFTALIKADLATYARLVKATGAKID